VFDAITNEEALVPVIVTDVMETAPVPALFTVML
jgi:hypothetical protein